MISDIGVIKAFPIDGDPYETFPKLQSKSVPLNLVVKSKFYKKRGATFFYDVTRKLGPLDFTQYRSKSSSF